MSESEDEVADTRASIVSSITSNPRFRSPGDDTASENGRSKQNLRLEIMMRKEKMRQEEEAQFTYKPTIVAKHSKSSPDLVGAKENRFDKLYSDALKRHIVGQLKDEVFAAPTGKGERELTFAPKISSKASRLSRSSSRDRLGISSSQPPSRDVSRTRGESEEKSSRGRSPSPRNGNTEYFKELTFKPTITKRGKSFDKTEQKDVTERLYQQIFAKKERQTQLAAEHVQRSLEECTFSPHLPAHKPKSVSGHLLDVTERMSRFEEFRKKKLEIAAKERLDAESEELTFKPSFYKPKNRSQSPAAANNTNSSANGGAGTPNGGKPHYAESRSASPISRKHPVEEMYAELTFQPKLVSRRSASPSTRDSAYANVHERLFHEGMDRKRELERQLEKKRAETSSELTFQPHIRGHSEHVKADQQLFARLAAPSHDTEQISHWKSEMEKELTFAPQLPTKSKQIVAKIETSTPLYDRAVAEQERHFQEAAKKLEEQRAREMEAATFHPVLPRRNPAITDAHDTTSDHDTGGVFRRLSSTLTLSAAMDHSISDDAQNSVPGSTHRKSVVMPERNIHELFERLHATVKVVEEAKPEAKVKFMPPEQLNQVVERLATRRTTSFAIKVDPDELEKIQPKFKESPLVQRKQLDQIVERLGSKKTASFAASTNNLLALAEKEGTAAFSPGALSRTKSTNAMMLGSPILRRSPSADQGNITAMSTPYSKALSPQPPTSNIKKVFKDIDASNSDSEGGGGGGRAAKSKPASKNRSPSIAASDVSGASGVSKKSSVSGKASGPRSITSTSKRGESKEPEVIIKVPAGKTIRRAPKVEGEEEGVEKETTAPAAVKLASAPVPAPAPVKFDSKPNTSGRPSDDFERKLQASMAMLTMPMGALSGAASPPAAPAPAPIEPAAAPAPKVKAPVPVAPAPPAPSDSAPEGSAAATTAAPARARVVKTGAVAAAAAAVEAAKKDNEEANAKTAARKAATPVGAKAAGGNKTPKKKAEEGALPPMSTEAREFMDSIPMVEVDEGSTVSGL